MKQSTTQDQAYLKECLAFHERRFIECRKEWLNSPQPDTDKEAKVNYHRAQVKWFKAKLQGYFRQPAPATVKPLYLNRILGTKLADTEAVGHDKLNDRLGISQPLTYTKPTPIKDFFRRALNRIRGV